ncbi:hypothetical protein [Flavobacterium tructae]|uniref:DUF3300 domain-containing protein n=1 Tax=Flavobacterium tructae TaxID=1114873 RepID=A0A1S1J726_9FLAO|nr:hypothetical protein [Flavobacterium tructae]OHT44946.1 hypothetical protein BHE19_09520 [Flavobacterium tructae]OXB18980.1 hypothetical protein B0A71_13640 [Flavobacterium tructae]
MKTKLLFIALLAIGLSSVPVQSQTTVYAKSSDISDNLDLRAVASIFGESANLQDFERRLNDSKYQISNLDLNDDNQVDYLRVIESVENRTHVVIIQAVLDRDVYQDVATIDVERDNYNRVNVQIVGNSYLYGANYIYEPVYNVAPVIYTSFWVTNYRPYYSSWSWNYYPRYYYAWRPYPIYRYRNNINLCINVNNSYNYVNTRRSYRAPVIYETRRTYGYETRRPDYSFAQRNSNATNRYDLDQRRVTTRDYGRNQNTYTTNRSNSDRVSTTDNRTSTRNYGENRTTSDRTYTTNRTSSNSRDNSGISTNPVRVENTGRRDYGQNNSNVSRRNSQSYGTTERVATPQRNESSRSYSENRGNSERQSSQNTQRYESPRATQESRGSEPQRESGSNGRSYGGRRI